MDRFSKRWKHTVRFLTEVREELSKVTWPARRELVVYTVVVLVTVAALGVFVFVLDRVFAKLSAELF